MNRIPLIALVACLPLLSACQRDPAPQTPAAGSDAPSTGEPTTALGRTVASAMEEARKELRAGNLSLNGDYNVQINGKRLHSNTRDLPAAEITPAGDLIIAGKTVTTSDATRQLASDYRAGIIAVAEAGMDLGVQGADLGMKAAGEAIGSLLRGDTEGLEKRIEAEAEQLEASATQLCQHLPALLLAQQALAGAVPEFAPYAKMDASDLDDCGQQHASRDESREAATNTAAEADAAADATSTP